MCGIAGCFVKNGKTIQGELMAIYSSQKDRGSQGAGISIMSRDEIVRVRDFSPEKILENDCLKGISQGNLVLFHHRFPTSTPNLPESNHPICNEDKTIHMVHNGIIYGHEGYGEDLKGLGHQFETTVASKHLYLTMTGQRYIRKTEEDFNDSEVIVHMLEENYENSWTEALSKTAVDICGSVALAFIVKGERKIYLYCNGYNPLWVYRDKFGNIFFSSSFPRKTKYNFRPVKELHAGEIGIIEKGWYSSVKKVLPENYYSQGGYGDDDEQLDFEEKLFWKERR